MDEQALLGLNPNADLDFRQRALAYFEQLKISPDAWQVCAEALAQRIYSDDHIKFFCFQVLEHQIKYKCSQLTEVQQQLIRETLITWLQAQMVNSQSEKTFIRNKAAQVFALLFVTEYLTKWPKFFFDILSVVGLNPRGVDLYLRILMAVDAELVDRDVVHTSEEARRNTLLKDTMREQCIPSLVESWYQILQTYQYTNSELTCQCLEVVGAYVSWIDLSLIANERFINMLLGHMSIEVLREEACDCLFEIVNKGMDPIDKTKLVETLCQVLQSAGLFIVDQEEDVDFLARFSKLINGMGQALIASWSKLVKIGDLKNAQDSLQAIEAKVALMLQLLIHEDDDISSNIIGFCYDYLHILKQLPVLSEQQKANVEAIMLAVMKKLTYDEEYNFENEGEDEAMFVEYRKQLKLLLDRLAQVSPELLLVSVRRVFNTTLQNWQTKPFMEVEVAIRLLYMLAEALPVSHSAHFTGDTKASALQDMMRTLVTSGISTYQHTSVTLEFFETVVRYEKFFSLEPQHIPNVLIAFLDHRGLRHTNPKVRSRIAYLFSRFVKSLKCIEQNTRPARAFSTCAENVEHVLFTIIQGAVDYPDPIAQKTCFIILSKLVELWGGKDGPVGFADFVYKHIVPACFLAPLKQTFDLADAQTVLALSECAVTLKTIHLKRGLECIQYLQQEYLPSLQVAPEIIQEFCQALQQPDAKVFKNYLKVFFQRAKP
ncbi:exportin-T isoform X2 [Ahaetulla prasina]|uniref:exportin-T isoform X2 n=1 Tax=Ahaetulla prasina TaxID=499056 RepID=UPI002648DEDB|nr:exportin-T isoform X2 [Ahaetulla prasina]